MKHPTNVPAAVTLVALLFLFPLRIGSFGEFVLQIGFIYVIVAVGLHLLVHWAGQISFGHVAFAALAAHVTARVAGAGQPFWVSIPAGAFAAIIASLLVGIPALRIRGFHLAILTFAFGYAADGWLFRQSWLTKGAEHLGGNTVPRPSLFGTEFSDAAIYQLILIVGVAVLFALTRLRRTKGGRAMTAVRDSEELAASFGINVAAYKVFAFMFAGGVAGLGGALWAYSLRVVDETAFPAGLSILFVSLVIIGGPGAVWETAIVALFFGILPPLLGAGPAEWFGLVGPVGLLLVILQYPGGQNEAGRELARGFRAVGTRLFPQIVGAQRRRVAFDASESHPSQRFLEVAEQLSGPGSAAPNETGVALEVRGLSIRFGGLQVLDRVNLIARQGAVTSLIGPNGAGKSTLLNCVSGFLRPNSGIISLLGEDVTARPPHQRARMGVGRTFQHLALCPEETIRQNLLIAQFRAVHYNPLTGIVGLPRVSKAEKEARERADEMLELFNLEQVAETPVQNVSIGIAKLAELASVLTCDPPVLLLDEPTGGLSIEETERFQVILQTLQKQRRLSIVLVAHDMRLIMTMTDFIYVLNFGEILAEGPAADIRRDPTVIETYLGSRVTRR